MKHLSYIIFMWLWLSGLVFAKGFAQTAVGIVFPPYAIYLVAERAYINIGWKQ